MIDAASIQAIAAVGGLLLAMTTMICGWTFWLYRELRAEARDNRAEVRDLRAEVRDLRTEIAGLRADMHRNHAELLLLLTGHTHADGSPPVFQLLPTGARE